MKTLHVLGLPYTVTCNNYEGCETTQKIYKCCQVFQNHPKYKTIHYGHSRSSTGCTEQVSVTTDEVLLSAYGQSLDTAARDLGDLAHAVFYANAKREINLRKQPGDLLLAFSKTVQPVADEIGKSGDIIIAEPSVSSAEAFSFFRCYESYPLKAAFAGTEGVSKDDPKWYWRVVPASFDVNEYRSEHDKDKWALYIASTPHPWGLAQAMDATGKAGINLKVCGEVDTVALNMPHWPAHVEYLGKVNHATKIELLARAYCGFLMSLRWEPFGSEVVEMMLSGCVPITTDLGAMTEYVVDGLNGFRCNTLRDMVRAIKCVDRVDRTRMMAFAQSNFSIAAVLPKYERAFSDFENVVDGRGWFDENDAVNVQPLGIDYRKLYV
jgi:glycosyltransferase involved in cell wall biosynthesis